MHFLLRFALFLTVTCSLLFGIHYYVWARLIRDTGLPAPWRAWGAAALFCLGALIPAGILLTRFLPRGVTAPLMWILYSWLGLVFYLTVFLALADLGRLLFVGLPLALRGESFDPGRRQFLASLLGGLVALGSLGISVFAFFRATAAAIEVKRIKVSLAQWPKALEGYRIVQITDIHLGPTIGKGFLEEIVRRVNALEPDLVAITGDLVDETLAELEPHAAPLKDLRAKDGIFFVTGNHEYYVGDIDKWLAWLSGIGIRPLRNERVEIRGGFDLAGTDDISAQGRDHRQDIPRALSGRSLEKPVILLAHQPRSFREAAGLGVDLQLAGHTHGGQIYPFNYIVGLFEPYVSGLHREGNSQIYVSCGTGYWGPPMRLGAPAEITEIRLERS